ncbi:ABC transporter permease subunit [bacterium]|nr:ABC transporter permease subunit [bacterium]
MSAPRLHPAAIIARQELRIALRNRWIFVYAAIFAALTGAVSYFGLSVIEFTGFQGFERTTVSLLNLVLYIVPLAAMLMTVQSFSVEGGATDQLFTEPVTRGEIVCGKLLGVGGAMAWATLLGFGLPAVLIARYAGMDGLSSYLILVLSTLLIAFSFCAISALITIALRRSLRAYAVVLVVWFLMVLVYDLTVIGVSFLLSEGYANRVAFVALFLNPVDCARVGTLLASVGKEAYGLAGAQLVRSLDGTEKAVGLLFLCLITWTLVPALASNRLLARQDI